MRINNIVLGSLFGLFCQTALSIEVVCRISDASTMKTNEAPAVVGTVAATKNTGGNSSRPVTNSSRLLSPSLPERCQQKMGCLRIKDRPASYILCDSTYAVRAQVYVGNVSIHIEGSAEQQELAVATASEDGFKSLTLRSRNPDVYVSCDLATEQNKECK